MIPAGETFQYECELVVNEPGSFEAQIDIYMDENGLRKVTLTIRGVGVAREASDAPKP